MNKTLEGMARTLELKKTDARTMTLAERLARHVQRRGDADCWEWSGNRDKFGYGRIDGRREGIFYAHRAAWVVANGAIPEGLYVLHKCDNPPCCNPAHLWLGTYKENSEDRQRKGRGKQHPDWPHLPRVTGDKHHSCKIADEQALEIYRSQERVTDLAKRYGVTLGTISAIKQGKRAAIAAALRAAAGEDKDINHAPLTPPA